MEKEENRASKQEVEDGIGIENSTIGYDPNRIPASIFSTKPTNPSEWSVASNESLFSIHMPNNSFSRDYAILYGKSVDLQDSQLRMSGELPRLDEWNKSQLKSSELIGLPVKSSHVKPQQDIRKRIKYWQQKHLGQPDVVTTNKTDITKTLSSPHTFPSPPRFSHDSGNNSANSFAFPLLLNDHGKPESLKVVPEKPEPPASRSEDLKLTSNASETRWFSFVMCWPKCC
ncbi:Unknown protein [Striga hermonthica]|uniref:Uncharacterized protein n=1 Tax=Striga hermonthica TaxID=68872 RepID=A0A9N7MXT3_STRHE|nr:Unknown protein [Striga hermonthica]